MTIVEFTLASVVFGDAVGLLVLLVCTFLGGICRSTGGGIRRDAANTGGGDVHTRQLLLLK